MNQAKKLYFIAAIIILLIAVLCFAAFRNWSEEAAPQVVSTKSYTTSYQHTIKDISFSAYYDSGYTVKDDTKQDESYCSETPPNSYLTNSDRIAVIEYRIYDTNCTKLRKESINGYYFAPTSSQEIQNSAKSTIIAETEITTGKFIMYSDTATICTNGCNKSKYNAGILILSGSHQGKVLQIINNSSESIDLFSVAQSIAFN